ncbi:50S ribosomal protein L27, partial [Candidatus Dojkabacteria bacterium]|nr:50S ribosomal protein L27 [Candidatus Dojkabacteria bacterium]
MAHTKATGAAKRNVDVAGKRLGIKKFAGEYVKPGNIILRQRGTKFYPGINTMIGKDHTIFAVSEGFVAFRQMTGYKRTQKWVDVNPKAEEKKAVKAVAAKKE